MSDFHAIGGVSATLQTLLVDRMELPDGVASVPPVTIGPPPFTAKDNDLHKEDPRVNLFLYRVSENGFLQNQEIPGRGNSGAFGHPPLSLNLHYLLTAYGNEDIKGAVTGYDDTNAQFLLGSAMRVLHDVPVITANVTTLRRPSGTIVLHKSLRDDYERVKLSLEPLTLEDVTKVWTALSLRMRLAAAYVVNVVQIESQRPRRFPRPVGRPLSATVPPLPADPPSPGPMVYALTIQTPTITDVRVRRGAGTPEQPFPYARVGDALILLGTSLSGAVTSVAFGDVVVPASYAQGNRVEVTIPDDAIPGVGPIPTELRLQPGVCTAQVVVRDPLMPRSTFRSNAVAFMLVPAVNAVTYGAGLPRRLTIDGTRLIGPSPGGETVVGRSVVPRTDYQPNATPTQIVVPLPDTLPTRRVHTLVGAPLLVEAIPIGAGKLDIDIGGTIRSSTATLPATATTIARSSVAGILTSLMHDALSADPLLNKTSDPRFTGARADPWCDSSGKFQLVVVPGGLTDTIAIAGGNFADNLGLTGMQPPGAGSAFMSGALTSPPPLSAPSPRVTVKVGTVRPAIVVAVAKPISLAALAVDLQQNINAAGNADPAYTNALVMVSGSQLLFIPGVAEDVSFDAAPGDDTTVRELQLHAQFAVRVRVNGAESIDTAVVELPR